VVATLTSLAQQGQVEAGVVDRAIQEFGIGPDHLEPGRDPDQREPGPARLEELLSRGGDRARRPGFRSTGNRGEHDQDRRAAQVLSPSVRYMDCRPSRPGPVKRLSTRLNPANIPVVSRAMLVSIFTPGSL